MDSRFVTSDVTTKAPLGKSLCLAGLSPPQQKTECRDGPCPSVAKLMLGCLPSILERRVRGVICVKDVVELSLEGMIGMDVAAVVDLVSPSLRFRLLLLLLVFLAVSCDMPSSERASRGSGRGGRANSTLC